MSHFQKRIQLLLLPHFRWFLISSFVATFGTGLSFVATSWLALRQHGGVVSLAILMFCFWVPNVFLGPFMGVLVDRYSRKHLMVLANVVRGLLFVFFGIYLNSHFSKEALYVSALLQGIFFSLFLPAVMSFVREVVGRKELLYANATIDMAYELGNIIGMGSAGLLIALSSAATTITINGVLFLVAAAALLMIRRYDGEYHDEKTVQERNYYQEFKEGFSYLFQNKLLLVIYTIQLLLLVEFMTAPILLAPFVKNVLHANVAQFGHIEAALSIGVVVSGIFSPWIAEKIGLIRALIVSTAFLGIIFLVFSYNRMIGFSEFLYFLIGLGLAVWPLIITRAQHMTDINFQGRVQSSFNAVSGVLVLLIYWLVALGSHYMSIAHLYYVEVGLSLLAFALLWGCRRRLYEVDRLEVDCSGSERPTPVS